MTAAPTPQPHTPVNFLRAGDLGGFSAACLKLLAKAGYSPDDFGNHAYVQARIRQAKMARQNYVDQCRANGTPPDPMGPDPHTAMLSRSQSGHLNQDAMFRAPGGRGDACANNLPPSGDARGYDSSSAPCMPMQSHGGAIGSNRNTIGSPHWAVSQNEAAQRGDPANTNRPLTQAEMSSQCRSNTALCTGGNRPDYAQRMGNVDPKRQAEATSRRTQAEDTRRASSAAVQGGGAGGGAGAAGAAGAGAAGGAISGNSAAECIDNFRKAAMERMRQDALKKYGQDYDKTKQAAQQRLADAQSARNSPPVNGPFKDHMADVRRRARNTLRRKSATPEEREAATWARNNPARAALQERRDARMAEQSAQAEVSGMGCMNRQVRSMCGMSTNRTGAFNVPNPPPNPGPPTGFFH